MFAKYSRISLLLFTSLNLQNAFGGGDTPVQVDPCDDIDLVVSNKKHPNPMFEEFHLEANFPAAINHVFYAVQEGRVVSKTIRVDGKTVELKYAEIPVYGWFEYTAGTEYLTIFQRNDFFNPCGYVGSTCTPATFARQMGGIAPARRWIPWQDVCRELDNPKNGKSVKRKILRQLREENLYGLLRRKGLPENLAFLDLYSPYVYRDDKMTDENWMSLYDSNGYPVRRASKGQASPKTVLNPYIKADPNAVEILPYRGPISSPAPRNFAYETTITNPQLAPGFPPTLAPGRPYNPSHFVELAPPPADDHYRIVPMETNPGRLPPHRIETTPEYRTEPVAEPSPAPQYKPTPSSPQYKPAPTPPQVPADSTYVPEDEEMSPPAPAKQKQKTPPPAADEDEESAAPSPPPSSQTSKTQPKKTNNGTPRVADAVPGKPGFVYYPEKPKMVDVRGFPSGSKVRDPDTQEIFIVP